MRLHRRVVHVIAISLLGLSVGKAEVPIFGGPTYDSVTGNGYTSFTPTPAPKYVSINEYGEAVCRCTYYVNGSSKGSKPFYWDTNGAIELPNLGANASGTYSAYAYLISNSGLIAGNGTDFTTGSYNGNQSYSMDRSGSFRILSLPPSSSTPQVNTINNNNWIAGSIRKFSGTYPVGFRPAVWTDNNSVIELQISGVSSLGTSFGQVNCINNSNVSAGEVQIYVNQNNMGTSAARWDSNGALTVLPSILGNVSSNTARVYWMNDNNIAVGESRQTSTIFAATRWDANGNLLVLPKPAAANGTEVSTRAFYVNSSGQSVGSATFYVSGVNTNTKAVSWDSAGLLHELPNPYVNSIGHYYSEANHINDQNYIVGRVTIYNPDDSWAARAVIWKPDYSMVDLNSLLPANSNWVLSDAQSITNNGWVVGYGEYDPDGSGPTLSYTRAFSLNINPSNKWNNSSGGNWNNRNNWYDLAVPTQDRDVSFESGGNYSLSLNADAKAKNILITQGDVTINPVGGRLIASGSIAVSNGASLAITSNGNTHGVTTCNSIQIDSASRLNLHDNDLIIDYSNKPSSYGSVLSLIKSGLTILGGNGKGIGSSEIDAQTISGTMLAIVDNGSIGGQIITTSGAPVPPNSVVVKYTWFGDSNLDGHVDGSDYALIDSGFTSGGSLGGWLYGDYDYNGATDASDYALIDTGFIQQSGVLPEPSLCSFIGIASILFSKRQIRTRR